MNFIKNIATVATKLTTPVVQAIKTITKGARRAWDTIWDRHCELMDSRPTYRAEILAAAAALLALLSPPTAIAEAVIALVTLYVASYGSTPRTPAPMAPTVGDGPAWGDGGHGKRLWDTDWDL